MTDNDLMVLEDAADALFTLDQEYRLAILNADIDKVEELKPQVEAAFDKYSLARLRLLETGVLATDADVAEMRRIKAQIDQAATLQTLVKGAVRLAVFLAKFI